MLRDESYCAIDRFVPDPLARFSIWHEGVDIPFYYTLPEPSLAPKLTQPKIAGQHTTIRQNAWLSIDGVLDAIVSGL